MNKVTIDKELLCLCVIATLRKLCSMLLGVELHVHTDHINILNIGDYLSDVFAGFLMLMNSDKNVDVIYNDDNNEDIMWKALIMSCCYFLKAILLNCALNLSGEESH
jgi:hypothetical protein